MKRWLPALLIAALPWATAVRADDLQDAVMQPYLTAALSYTFRDPQRNSQGGVGAYTGGGIALGRWFGFEGGIFYDHYNAHRPSGARWDAYGGRINGMFFFNRNPWFEPFFQIGVGAVRNNSQDLSSTVVQGNPHPNIHISSPGLIGTAGFGEFTYFHLFGVPVAFRADILYKYESVRSGRFNNLQTLRGYQYSLDRPGFREEVFDIGIVIPLGHAHHPAPPPPPPPPPPPQPGVTNPQPPAPPAVQRENPNVKFEDVHFAFDKYALTSYAQTSLDGDAATINRLVQQYPNLQIDVSGHTDWIGSAAYNLGLSERRANSVKDYLEHKGVDAGRMHSFAYGLTRPVAPNTTTEGRALNRRAEVRSHDQ